MRRLDASARRMRVGEAARARQRSSKRNRARAYRGGQHVSAGLRELAGAVRLERKEALEVLPPPAARRPARQLAASMRWI